MSSISIATLPELAAMSNGQAIALEAIPRLSLADLQAAIGRGVAQGQRVAALFGAASTTPGVVELVLVLADDQQGRLLLARSELAGDSFPALTPVCPQVHLFERELAEQFGLRAEGHPWFKPLRFHRSWTGRDAWGRAAEQAITPGVTDFYQVSGEQVHEVAVGPVHAGVIEPGHFRFQCHGEQVFHLEIVLGYQHRGVEQALVTQPAKRHLHYAETLAGDSTIAHGTAYCQIMEALGQAQVSPRAQALRGIALELERLANHVGDLGALSGDVGYLPTAAYCGRLRGDFLNMTAMLCGNRFGRGLLRPGGVSFDLSTAQVAELQLRLEAARGDTEGAVSLLWDTPSVMARFEDTGALTRTVAQDLGLVGPAARATGLRRDIRHDHPAGIYRFAQMPVSTFDTGDVFARAFVRWLEVQHSVRFIAEQLEHLPPGGLRVPVAPALPNRLALALVEGWRGEVCQVALTDDAGRLRRYKVVDPSFHNWAGLAHALRHQEISDFPLCNKSFNLSYCGHDL